MPRRARRRPRGRRRPSRRPPSRSCRSGTRPCPRDRGGRPAGDDPERARAAGEDVQAPVVHTLEHLRSPRAADRPQAVVGGPDDAELVPASRHGRSSSCSAPRRCAAGPARGEARRDRAGRAGSRAPRRPASSLSLRRTYRRRWPVPRSSGTGATCACTTIRPCAARSTSSTAWCRSSCSMTPSSRGVPARAAHRVHARVPARARRVLRERGGGLVVRHGRPSARSRRWPPRRDATAVLWTSDVSPYARARDTRVTEALRETGIEPMPSTGNYASTSRGPAPATGGRSTVFSPFWRAWRDASSGGPCTARRRAAGAAERGRKGGCPRSTRWARRRRARAAVAPGEAAARVALDALARRSCRPLRRAPRPLAGHRELSPYLRWGCLSARECEERARRGGRGASAWVRQLCWRDFHAHVLLPTPRARPRSCRSATARRRVGATTRSASPRGRRAHRLSRSSTPACASSRSTGWMHNRARLVVGSFLTKDLHLDWRAGEECFARLLLDGEPAQNNGNWQWIAGRSGPTRRRRSGGCTTRRASRSASTPTGEYVRRWVPELRDVPDERLAEPWTMSDEEQAAAGCVIGAHYPAPIVARPRTPGSADISWITAVDHSRTHAAGSFDLACGRRLPLAVLSANHTSVAPSTPFKAFEPRARARHERLLRAHDDQAVERRRKRRVLRTGSSAYQARRCRARPHPHADRAGRHNISTPNMLTLGERRREHSATRGRHPPFTEFRALQHHCCRVALLGLFHARAPHAHGRSSARSDTIQQRLSLAQPFYGAATTNNLRTRLRATARNLDRALDLLAVAAPVDRLSTSRPDYGKRMVDSPASSYRT